MTIQRNAPLRVCASCEWIFDATPTSKEKGCPKCGFAHYGARFVYGKKAYRYKVSQKPWYDKKMAAYSSKLQQEISASAKPVGKGLKF